MPKTLKSRQLIGCLCIFASAFCFYLATTVIRWSKGHVFIDPAFFAFARFLMGFIVICAVMGLKRQPFRPRRYDLLFGRMAFNCIAVYCFYKSVDLTSVAEGNILNMTFPVFVALFSWILLKEQRDMTAIGMVLIAFAGIWLILSPQNMGFKIGNLWGLASGIIASFSMICLNLSRRHHDSETILFFMFGLGAIAMWLVFHDKIFIPTNRAELYYLTLCSVFGIGGQYLITIGFLFVTAVEGSIISSTRILLAALLGPFIASDPALSLSGWIGAGLIFTTNVYLALRKAGQ
jgi:drug/metabolite transporter (DMT)-like permease